MTTPATEEDTLPKVLIRGEWCKVHPVRSVTSGSSMS